MMRAPVLVLVVALGSGCATSGANRTGSDGLSGRKIAAGVLIGVAVASAGMATFAMTKGNRIERDLRDDLATGTLTGRQFAERDADGLRWNRVARASGFVGGLSLIGLGILWEMAIGDRAASAAAPSAAPQPQSWATAK